MEFGEYLKDLREKRGMTIRQLATYAEVSNSYISQIESGNRNPPTPDILRRIAKALRVPYYYLMKAAGYLEEEDIVNGAAARNPDIPGPLSKEELEIITKAADIINEKLSRKGLLWRE